MIIKFSDFKKRVLTLCFPDEDIFHKSGLKKLKSSYKSYPFGYKGKKMFLFLPIEMRPKQLENLNEEEAIEQRIFLLKEEQGRIEKAWPLPSDVVNK